MSGRRQSSEQSSSTSSTCDLDDEERHKLIAPEQIQLMQACAEGDKTYVARLLEHESTDPSYEDRQQSIRPCVYIATKNGHLDLLQYLITDKKCDLYYKTARGTTLLHLAARKGYVDIVRWLAKTKGLDPSKHNQHGGMPLHIACEGGHIEVVKFLVKELNCDPQLFGGLPEAPLHTACIDGRIDIVRYFLDVCNCDCDLKTRDGESLLHLAAQRGRMNIIEYLVSEKGCDVNVMTNRCYTPLHLAAQSNKPAAVEYLLSDPRCKTMCRTTRSFTPMHFAARFGRLEVMKTMMTRKEVRDDINHTTIDGYTSLHLACEKGHKEVVHYLLDKIGINPSIPGPKGKTPIQLTDRPDLVKMLIQYGANPTEANISVYSPLPKQNIEDIVRIMVIGDPSTGKSTLVEALKTLPVTGFIKSRFSTKKSNLVQISPCTPGIVPHELISSDFGRVLLFDFAGHSEYYTSHTVVIESAVKTTAPIFLLVVDLSKGFHEIQQRIYYWISFLENVRPSLNSRPYLVIVGSHLDVLNKKPDHKKQLQKVEEIINHFLINSSFNFAGFCSLDCTSPGTQANLRDCLKRSCATLRTNSNDDVICHAFYTFLTNEFGGKIMITLKDVARAIKTTNQPFPHIPSYLCALSERVTNIANIMLFKNTNKIEETSIVLEVKTLLAKIQAVLFAPQEFVSIQNSFNADTGIISYTELARTFPDFDDERLGVIIQFIERLEIGQPIRDKETLQLMMRRSPPPEAFGPSEGLKDGLERFLFLPPLIDEHRPVAVWRPDPSFQYTTGWCLQCSLDIQQFPPRFIHALLLRLAFSFAVANQDTLHSHHSLGRECTLWKSGIHWLDLNGIETIVEVVEDGQVIVMAMRSMESTPLKCLKLRAAVIEKILDAKNLYASQIATDEFLVSPDTLGHFPLHGIRHNSAYLYSVSMLAHSIIKEFPFVKSIKAEVMTRINELLYWDPYIGLGEDILKVLFDQEAQDLPLSNDFLFRFSQKKAESWFVLGFNVFKLGRATLEIIRDRSEGREHVMCMHVLETFCQRDVHVSVRSLRSELDQYSIFCGRNILMWDGLPSPSSFV